MDNEKFNIAAEQARIDAKIKAGDFDVRTVKDLKNLKPGLTYDYNKVLNMCLGFLQDTSRSDRDIVLPVNEFQHTKKNKVYMEPSDRSSPTGVVEKTNAYALRQNYPCAAARFDLIQVISWLSLKIAQTPDLTPEEQSGILSDSPEPTVEDQIEHAG